MIVVTNALSPEQELEARQLLATCQAYDGTRRLPYLSNQYNFDPEMPAFFLAYENQELVGLLTVYADDEEAMLGLFVTPRARRQGHARKLYQRCCEELAAYPVTEMTFQTERVFLDQHPELLEAWGLVEEAETEFQLGRGRQPFGETERADVIFSLACDHHAPGIAAFQAASFDNDAEVALRYAREAISDSSSRLYILEKDGEILASCTVDLTSPYNYLYGLAVAEPYRGQGLGTHLVKRLMDELLALNDKPFQIAVESTNPAAHRLYERIGFVVETEVIYLEKKEKINVIK